ncbi:MAG TPA: TlpA disulfide reductase family protein [Flavisolibacter sp.]|nr:TlpA disulfide reductase family protein [Flavisolibacter sp.]
MKIYQWKISYALFICLFPLVLWSQQNLTDTKIIQRKVGDTVADIRLDNLINFPRTSAHLSEFKGQIVILDFWNTYCLGCIQSWAKLLSLQKKFGDRIKVILINPWQSNAVIRAAFQKRKKIANIDMTLPCASGDTSLFALFGVSGVPYLVWLDENRVIKGISGSDMMNEKNINGLLQNSAYRFRPHISNDDIISVRIDKPLFLDGNGGKPRRILGQSIFAKGSDSLFPAIGMLSDSVYGSFVGGNACIKDLYRLAYSDRRSANGQILKMMPNRISLEMKDTAEYVVTIDGEYDYTHNFAYQLLAPGADYNTLQEYFQKDLDRYIGLKVEKEKRRMKCLVLSVDDTTKISYKEGGPLRFVTESLIRYNKHPISTLIEQLEDILPAYYNSPYPIVNETHFSGELGNILIETDIMNYKALDRALSRYGMHLKLEERTIEVVVLKDPVAKD